MKKKPARQPRKIEVVEDAPVATVEPKATKAKAPKSTKTKPAPTDATPTIVDQPAAEPEPNATVAKSGAKKRKAKAEAPATEPSATTKRKTKANEPKPEATQSERKPEQTATVEGKLTGKLSAIDAAAKVLEDGSPRNCKELIEAMSTQGLWTSPGGKTPHATLYSAILREITTKGDESRFVKTERGRFARKGA
jgi:hypothetical protein